LPPSFHRVNGDNFATLDYYVKAFVDGPSGHEAADKRYFKVLSAMPMTQWQAKKSEHLDREFKMTFCCCFDKGKVTAKFSVDRTVIAADRDNLVVFVDVDNTHGKEPIESANIQLVNNFEIRADGKTDVIRATLGSVNIARSVEPGKQARFQGAITLKDRNFVPSLTSFNTTSRYTIVIGLHSSWASDIQVDFPATVVPTVDESNQLPALSPDSCGYRKIPSQAIETYYAAPLSPVYVFHAAPLMTPHKPPLISPQVPLYKMLPAQNAKWGGVGFEQAPQAQVAWGQGQLMHELPWREPTAPPAQTEFGAPLPTEPTSHTTAPPYG